jgi:hypothetical protein
MPWQDSLSVFRTPMTCNRGAISMPTVMPILFGITQPLNFVKEEAWKIVSGSLIVFVPARLF